MFHPSFTLSIMTFFLKNITLNVVFKSLRFNLAYFIHTGGINVLSGNVTDTRTQPFIV